MLGRKWDFQNKGMSRWTGSPTALFASQRNLILTLRPDGAITGTGT